jgi:hypothetical protein
LKPQPFFLYGLECAANIRLKISGGSLPQFIKAGGITGVQSEIMEFSEDVKTMGLSFWLGASSNTVMERFN